MEISPRSAVVIGPMGVGQVIDAGLKLARENYRLLIVTTAWGGVPAFVVGAILGLALGLPGLVTAVTALGQFVSSVAVVIACAHLIAPTGVVDELAPGPLYRLAGKRIWRYLLWLLLFVVLAIPLIIIFPLGIYLGVRWAVSGISVAVDGDGPIQSFRRSWDLTKRAWWHTFLVLVVFSVLYAVVLGLVIVLFNAVAGILTFGGATVVGNIVSTLGSAVGSIFVAPIAAAIEVVLYYELRARREGFDLTSRASQVWPTP